MNSQVLDERKWNVLTTKPPGSEEWNEKHVGKWGGNDIASILGVGFKSRLRLWGETTGRIEREDISRKPHVRLGTLLEPIVKQLYTDERGDKILPSPGLVQHPTLDYVAVTSDGIIEREGQPLANFSAKTFNVFRRKEWERDVPLRAQVQAHAEMWVLGIDVTIYAALCRDGEIEEEEDADEQYVPREDSLLLWAERERRNDLIELIGNEVVDFREKHVVRDIPPDPGSDLKVVKAIWKKEIPDKVATLSAELELAWFRNKELAAMRTAAKKEQDEIKAKILVAMGDAEYGLTPGNMVLRAREYTVEPKMHPGYSARPLISVKKIGA